ncbi:MAG: TIGR04282 family arsenosugar biosynthesis glycosyltransferase [Acidobacteriota bacterium]|nr:TIGR04282 family arsenosugar biosynthesis glycosyltransferase [Acidobacteriota bacterium]
MTPFEVILVFVKHPEPGRVKTRLAAGVGNERSAEVYRRLAERTLRTVRAAATAPGRRVRLAVDPPQRVADVSRWLGPDFPAAPQAAGHLGERMSAAFADAFEDGAQRVVIVGTDCPGLAPFDIDAAFTALSTNDVVVGPAEDGGYWLLGLAEHRPPLFEDIAWSEPDVLTRTLLKLRRAAVRFILLRTLRDVDTVEDLRALVPELESPAPPPPAARPDSPHATGDLP